MKFFCSLLLLLTLSFGEQTAAQEADATTDALIIATQVAPPFAMRDEDGEWSGISLELLELVAERMGFEYELVEAGLDDMISGVADGTYDASMGALSVTADRLRTVDFSFPYFRTGLGVAASSNRPLGYEALFRAVTSREFLVMLTALAVLLTVVGALAWKAEHRRNPEEFEPERVRGLFSGFWWAAVTMTTVGYGDKAPITLLGRLIALWWMFTALVLTSLITAQLAASLTYEHDGYRLGSLSDLSKARVGVIQDSSATRQLITFGVVPINFDELAVGFDSLRDGSIDAFVHDSPILVALSRFSDDVGVLPITFAPQDYAIALPYGSDLREPINRALVGILNSDDWAILIQRHLGGLL